MVARRAISLTTFGIFAAILALATWVHEPWADEAQQWLLVRDSPLWIFFTEEIRYTGHPSLWYLFLVLPAKLHLPYHTIKLLSFAATACSAVLFIRYSPFPRAITLSFPFTYFFLYQYGAISRNYVLVPLLLILLAMVEPKRLEKPAWYFVFLGLLAHLHVLTFIFTGWLLVFHAIDVVNQWRQLTPRQKRQHVYGATAVIFAMSLVVLQLWAPDREWHHDPNWSFRRFPLFASVIFNRILCEQRVLSAIVFALSGAWLFFRGYLFQFVLISLSILLFGWVIYWKFWHEGILFFVWFYYMWLSFVDTSHTTSDIASDQWWRKLATLGMAILIGVQIYWSAVVIRNDYYGDYSAGQSVATYLKENGLDKKSIAGFKYWSISVLPYFDEPLYSNYETLKSPGYRYWLDLSTVKGSVYSVIEKSAPDVLAIARPGISSRYIPHYQRVRVFKGSMWWKTGIREQNDIALYVRVPTKER